MKSNQFRVKSANAFAACKMQQMELKKIAMEQLQEGSGEGSKMSQFMQERIAEMEEAHAQITGTYDSLVKYLHEDKRTIIPELLE